ncbi:type I restriction-modification enzyme R subunit C-terminal domain-containing protein [Nocardia farcinica]|uniref:type I restriction-modification enzyme R subunit C-terminal domain-containing protein n=1 Tax=Nocardia farcinica TaxID=37329 RepID=UPI002F4127C3
MSYHDTPTDLRCQQLSSKSAAQATNRHRKAVAQRSWRAAVAEMLEHARRELRSIVGLLDKKKRVVVHTDFTDTLGDIVERDMPEMRSGTDVERYTAKVRDYLRRQPDNLALQKLRSGKPLTAADLESLEELLARSGAGEPDDMARAIDNAHGLGHFIRSLVGLDQQAVQEAFAEFLGERTATASQIDFVNLIIGHLTRHGEMDPKLLFEPPFTDAAPRGRHSCSHPIRRNGWWASSGRSTIPWSRPPDHEQGGARSEQGRSIHELASPAARFGCRSFGRYRGTGVGCTFAINDRGNARSPSELIQQVQSPCVYSERRRRRGSRQCGRKGGVEDVAKSGSRSEKAV